MACDSGLSSYSLGDSLKLARDHQSPTELWGKDLVTKLVADVRVLLIITTDAMKNALTSLDAADRGNSGETFTNIRGVMLSAACRERLQ